MKKLFLLAWCISLTALAEGEARQAYLRFEATAPSPDCLKRMKQLSTFRHLFSVKPFREWLGSSGGKLVLGPSVKGWSTDLLAEMVQEIDQKYSSACARPLEMEVISDALRTIYLEGLGIGTERFSVNDRAALFRALAVPKRDFEVLKAKLGESVKGDLGQIVSAAYGGTARLMKGVWVLNASEASAEIVEKWLNSLCGGEVCEFWDPVFLWRVVVGPSRGVAAFVPEFGALIVSASLLESSSVLHHLVFVHELTHVAEARAKARGENWEKDFAPLSGWKTDHRKWTLETQTVKSSRLDALSELSLNSPYSILPESGVVFGFGRGKRLDGFVFEKTYREALRRGDLSEDIADHVATFHVFPQRFCFQGKNIAPGKEAWVRRRFFPSSNPVDCSKKSS